MSYVFDYFPLDENVPLTLGRDLTMKENMGKLWTNFILTGFLHLHTQV